MDDDTAEKVLLAGRRPHIARETSRETSICSMVCNMTSQGISE